MSQASEYGNVRITQSHEDKGERAKLSNIVGSIAIADLVKTTLGPKGMDKILQSGDKEGKVSVTNDGATILKSLMIDNPAANILVDISKSQDDVVGDGTTSVCVFAGELLRAAEKLLQSKIHPQVVIQGWRLAAQAAQEALEKAASNNAENQEKFRQDLINIARTSLSSKILYTSKDHFAKLAVDAVLRLKGSTNLESIQVLKKLGGSLKDSFLEEGFMLDKSIGVGQPKKVQNAKVLIANTPMDTDKIKIHSAKVKTSSISQLADIEKAEKEKMHDKCEKIKNHDINVFINRQLIYNYPEEYFADNGIMGIEHADFEGVERLALVLGGEITSTFDHPDQVKLGECESVEETMVGEDKVIRFSGVKGGEACTIVLRGGSQHIIDEAERSLHDALCVVSQTVNETRTVYGGGCAEMIMAKAVDDLAKKTPGKKSLAMEVFAEALRQLPSIIADNGGYDSAELISQLSAAHYQGNDTACLNMNGGTLGDASELGIVESYKVKYNVLKSAAEAAEMILRVDDIIRCMPRQRQ
eukprot:gb/GECH01011940.1/.p1 GENE.gb/GECH01011940.1/~~gb/GECH01011940.1/.p1  ORF type:complete len:529 (+),score=161.12 gb/GECH01011940.1/:1-1587(+)